MTTEIRRNIRKPQGRFHDSKSLPVVITHVNKPSCWVSRDCD